MTKYAEEIRERYRQWLVKPKKAAEVLKQRGETEVAEEVFTEIQQIEELIEQVHGDLYDPETPAEKMHIHIEIIYRSANLDVNDKLLPIYAELDRLAKEQEGKTKKTALASANKQKGATIFQRIFGRNKKGKSKQYLKKSPEISSYTDECVRRFEQSKKEYEIDKYYESFIKPEKEKYIEHFMAILESLQTKHQNEILSVAECAELLLKGVPQTVIEAYNRKVKEVKELQRFKPDKTTSGIIRKALIEDFYSKPYIVDEQIGKVRVVYGPYVGYNRPFFVYWQWIKGNIMTIKKWESQINQNSHDDGKESKDFLAIDNPKLKDNNLVFNRIKGEDKMLSSQDTDGLFFHFAKIVLDSQHNMDMKGFNMCDIVWDRKETQYFDMWYAMTKYQNDFLHKQYDESDKKIELFLNFTEDIRELEKAAYISDKEKQKALIDLMCDGVKGENDTKRREALELYFQIKDLYEGFKRELPKEYEEAKKQTIVAYGQAITDVKKLLAELIKMKKDFYTKTPEELEKLYGDSVEPHDGGNR